ncbi:MAG: GNAT family N-acetyltransferase [Clostridiaceae bacterium]|nr:GNAT family N-acetyltransferase [Clostridiaceae bacterium]
METERLLIRRFMPGDAGGLFEYLSREAVVRYEPYSVFTREQAEVEAMRRAGDPNFLAVCLRDSGRLIGNLYLAPGEFDTWELGYVFHDGYQGKGYATEAARAVTDELFESGKARRIVAMCNPENTASWRILERLGMRREGHFREKVWFRKDSDGFPIWQDTYAYAILRSEWEKNRSPAQD